MSKRFFNKHFNKLFALFFITHRNKMILDQIEECKEAKINFKRRITGKYC
jgi:hypothetical protein